MRWFAHAILSPAVQISLLNIFLSISGLFSLIVHGLYCLGLSPPWNCVPGAKLVDQGAKNTMGLMPRGQKHHGFDAQGPHAGC